MPSSIPIVELQQKKKWNKAIITEELCLFIKRMRIDRKSITVWNIYLFWTGLTGISIILIPLILGATTSGGEQKPLIWISIVVTPIIWGYLIISILTSFLSRKWIQEYWYVNLGVLVLTVWILFNYYFE